jgi:hypothetical protein
MKTKVVAGAIATAALASAAAFGQECTPAVSPAQCFNDVQVAANQQLRAAKSVDATAADTKAAAEVKTDTQLAEAQTGANSAGTATASTFNDLAPLFEALGLVSQGDPEGGKLSLNLNFILPVADVENNNSQLKLLVNTQPEPLDELVQAFGETVREARKDSLQKDISTFGDAQLSFTWSLVNGRFGRDYRVLRPLVSPLIDGAVASGRAHAAATRVDLRQALGNLGISMDDADKPIAQLAKSMPGADPADERKIIEAAVKAGESRLADFTAINNELERTGLDQLAKLVEQQPQLLFSLTHDIRDEIVGPEKTAVTVTWEMTRKNLSSFLHGPGIMCAKPEIAKGTAAEYGACTTALRNYVGDGGINLENQWRFKLAASYQRVEELEFRYPDDEVELNLPETDRWEVSVGAGRPIQSKTGTDRLDFELTYDSNIDNDTSNKERLKASLTYTRHLGDMDLPFSIVYANKNEFLGEVDHQISMHVGLKFRNE